MEAAAAGLKWLLPRQELDVVGDWSARRPNVRPGGWAFQFANPHYPDLDDTAVVVMAMDRQQRARGHQSFHDAIERAKEWICGLQSRNGGWGAFDADNNFLYLNNIPFSDHGALLDPPTEDVTGRCVSMLAQLGERSGDQPCPARGFELSSPNAVGGRKLVRPLGHELHLRNLVGALRAQHGRGGSQRAGNGARRRLARGHSKRRRRLGRGWRKL